MLFKDFIKEKITYIIFTLLTIAMIEILLMPFQINNWIKVYIAVIPFILLSIAIFIEFKSKRTFYNDLKEKIQELDNKYLISEIIETPNFIEGKVLKEVMQDAGKSMLENVNEYKYLQEDYKEYIELWIHEIKLPIAASKMIIENNKNKATKSIEEEIDKIENYTEQALFYARSNTVEKDYIISKASLQEIVNSVIIKNKSLLISNKININLHDLEKEVYIDSKWVIFILSQIIQNAIKYSKKEDKMIEIYS